MKKTPVDELRTSVNAARSLLGISASTFTDSTITAQSTVVKATT